MLCREVRRGFGRELDLELQLAAPPLEPAQPHMFRYRQRGLVVGLLTRYSFTLLPTVVSLISSSRTTCAIGWEVPTSILAASVTAPGCRATWRPAEPRNNPSTHKSANSRPTPSLTER